MFNLYFNDNYGNNRFVATCHEGDVTMNIRKYVKKLNPKYKIYYIRTWTEKDKTWYDVGSHSEFFYTERAD